MNIRETISIQSPNGIEEECAMFIIDDIATPFVLKSVTDINEEYVFSAWVMSDRNSSITIENNKINLSTEWQKQKVVFKASGNSLEIYFNTTGTYYLYKSQLEKGNIATDWAPSPLDLEASLELKVNTDDLISEINASANVIRLKSNRLAVDSDNLTITEDGKIKAKDGEFTGTIKGSSGEFTEGFKVELTDDHRRVFSMQMTEDEYDEKNIFRIQYDSDDLQRTYFRLSPGYLEFYSSKVDMYAVRGYNFKSSGSITLDASSIYVKDSLGESISGTEENFELLTEIRKLRNNKVLWSGSYYMSEQHTITLQEPISKQLNGIVLVFSEYSNGTAHDLSFNEFFVPKYIVEEKYGKGHIFQMTTSGLGVYAVKELMISDGFITGVANNVKTYTGGCGIKVINNGFVLRYVIGV